MFYLLLQKFKVDANSVKFGHGCRKGFDNQHALVSLIERWQKYLDSKGCRDTVLIDLSQAFNARFHAYGFDTKILKLLYSYLTNR